MRDPWPAGELEGDMSGRNRTSAAGRSAAIVCWIFAEAFGLPAIPVAVFKAREGRLPWLWDLFPMYGGPWSESVASKQFVVTLVAFLIVSQVVAFAGRLVWRGHRSGAVLSVATLPFEVVFWIGYALPIPPIGAMLRVLLLAVAWDGLAPKTVGGPQQANRSAGRSQDA
jgi:hypothetical protein